MSITIVPIRTLLSNGITDIVYAYQVTNSAQVVGQNIRFHITVYKSSVQAESNILATFSEVILNAGNQLPDVQFIRDLKLVPSVDLNIFNSPLLVTTHITGSQFQEMADNSPNILLEDSNPPSSTDNFDIVLTAENNKELTGTATAIDKDFIQVQLGLFNASMVFSPSTSTANLTAEAMLQFITNNQVFRIDAIAQAQNGATLPVVLLLTDFHILQESLALWGAFITGTLTTLPVNSSIAIVEQFAQDNQEISPTNFDVTVTAEDGAQLGGTLTVFEKDVVLTRIGEFNATANAIATTSPAFSTSVILLGFAEEHQLIPPPICPVGFTLNVAGLCTSPANEPAPPNSKLCEACGFYIPIDKMCPVCDPPEPPDTSIEDTSVSISPSNFELIDGRLKGEIKYVANSNFNPLYFDPQFHVGALVKYTEENGVNHFVEQTLHFTETERDENQTINEDAFGNRLLSVEFFVLSALNVPFAKNFGLSVSEGLPPCPVGFHQENGICVKDKVEAGKVIQIIKGAFFGSLALALLGSRGR